MNLKINKKMTLTIILFKNKIKTLSNQKKSNIKNKQVRKTPVPDRSSSEKSPGESAPLRLIENSQNYQI